MEKVPGHGLCPDLSGPGRPARSRQIPDRSQIPPKLPSLATSYLEIAHWSILLRGIEGHGEDLDENGCFTSRTCVLRLDRYGSSGYFLFEKHSLIDFQIGKGRKREFRAAELRFSLHKESYEIFGGRPCRKWLFSKGKIGQRWADFRIFQ